ncbi:MAG TPA: undecaprenyl-diphosphate phosphatase, partial [Trebonia sp.]|nr:undecaprenyl-diphosphate phosphatase [Trebonia sp.]
MSHLTFVEASVVGFLQGVTELFPISSLGHSVLVPAVIGGSWARDLNFSGKDSPYLAFIVGMHVCTAIAMIIYFWRDWVRIIRGFFSSLRDRAAQTTEQRLAWMIIIGTIPVGVVGALAQHAFEDIFSKAVLAAYFLMANGVILFAAEKWRPQASRDADRRVAAERQQEDAGQAAPSRREMAADRRRRASDWQSEDWQSAPSRREMAMAPAGQRIAGRHASGHVAVRQQELSDALRADERLARVGYLQALIIGGAQVLALFAGISRDGIVMVGGMFRGLAREDAARFSFLLSTPVILAAGVLKLP